MLTRAQRVPKTDEIREGRSIVFRFGCSTVEAFDLDDLMTGVVERIYENGGAHRAIIRCNDGALVDVWVSSLRLVDADDEA